MRKKSYYVMSDKIVQKETNMRFDGNFRNSQRADYEQFAGFLGLNNKPMQRMEQRPSYDSSVNAENCGCKNDTHLAMVYPVKQEWCDIYDVEIALVNGTIFSQLNKPFYKSSCSGKNKEGCL